MTRIQHLATASILTAFAAFFFAPTTFAAGPEASIKNSTQRAKTSARTGMWAPELYERLRQAAPNLDPKVLSHALDAAECARFRGEVQRNILSVIDYSLPSTADRLWIFDLRSGKLLFNDLVSHGKNTGQNYAKHFSNINGSKQTSIGLFRTGATYMGGNGYSLKLHGLEDGINDLAYVRTIVMHGAWYVNDDLVKSQGRIGRSWGCPAVRKELTRPVIDAVKGGSLLFAYYPDRDWLTTSPYLNGCQAGGAIADNGIANGRSSR